MFLSIFYNFFKNLNIIYIHLIFKNISKCYIDLLEMFYYEFIKHSSHYCFA